MDKRLKWSALGVCIMLVAGIITFGVSATQGLVAQYGVNETLPLAFVLLALFGAGVWGVLLLAYDLWLDHRCANAPGGNYRLVIASDSDGNGLYLMHLNESSALLRGGMAQVILFTWLNVRKRGALAGDDYLHGVLQGLCHADAVAREHKR